MGKIAVAPLVGAWIEILIKAIASLTFIASLPLWERGLKCFIPIIIFSDVGVAPLVGAWIEILEDYTSKPYGILSLPLWERGLKSAASITELGEVVAPLVGAWIEMGYIHHQDGENMVAPLVGAWIEIASNASG